MFYTIYKTTNLINGKYYIGKHQTKNLDDGYVGSGKLLKYAIKKYGIENFVTDILFVYDEEWKMNLAEKILVVPDVEISYNLCPGGHGGFGFINKIRDHVEHNKKLAKSRDYSKTDNTNKIKNNKNPDFIARATKSRKENGNSFIPYTKGMKYSKDSKLLMSKKAKGARNSQYGTCWITNGLENKKIPLNSLDEWISQGYRRGRI